MNTKQNSANSAGENVEDISLEAMLTRLGEVVRHLETNQVSLEESLSLYEEGVNLAKKSHQKLNDAEKKIEILARATQSEFAKQAFEARADSFDQ